MSQSVHIVGPNVSFADGATFHVHAAGCAHLKRRPLRDYARDGWTMEANSQTDVCDAVYPPEEFQCNSGEYLDLGEFTFAPCVQLAK